MNKIISIVLILSLSVPTLRTFVVFADYQINRTELTQKECENIEVDSNCQATCHLVKEVKKESPESEGFPFLPTKLSKYEVLYFEIENDLSPKVEKQINVVDNYQIRNFDEHTFGIFHPPKHFFYT